MVRLTGITKPETINYRALKPEMTACFVSASGPAKDWEMSLRGKHNHGIQVWNAGVEVTESRKCRRVYQTCRPQGSRLVSQGIPATFHLLHKFLRDVEINATSMFT